MLEYSEPSQQRRGKSVGCGDNRQCRPWACTMDVLSMLKHSIISDNVNPITTYFELGRQTGSAGPEMVWKIFEAVRKEDKKEASVFLFEKKIADKLHKPRRREIVADVLRKGIWHLERLKHPQILSLLHGVEECHDSLAFATEPVFCSLANVLGNYERMPANIPPEIRDFEFIELEIKIGVLQLADALSYLHGTEQLIHRNVCPQSVLLTRRGVWKLSGFYFTEKKPDGKESLTVQAWTGKIPKMAQPDLNFLAPEVQLGRTCSPLSDMFSLGMVVCSLYNAGHSLIAADHNPNIYVKQLDQMHDLFGVVAHKMPMALVEPVEKMINKDVRYRPSAQLFSLLKYFNDPVAISLHALACTDRRDPGGRADAYASLSQVIPNIPRKILYKHVLPTVVEESKQSDSVVYALPTLLTIIDFATRDDYCDIILTEFCAMLNLPKPVQATVYILNKLDIILSKTPLEEIRSEILPMVFNTLDSSSLQAQEAAIGAIGVVKEYLDDEILRKMVLPKAKSLFFRSTNVKMRINALSCIDHLLESLDKMLILDDVLPFLTDITCQDPDVVVAVVSIYKHMLSDKRFGLTHNLLATKVMPSLIPHTVNPGLNLEQFSALMEVLRDMLEQVDKQRRNKMKLETVTIPVPHRGSIKMQPGDDGTDPILLIDSRALTQKSNRPAPSTPELQQRPRVASPKNQQKNHSLQCLGMSLDEKSTLDKPVDAQRRHSLVPPSSGGTPTISITSEDAHSPDRSRRPSTHSLGPFSDLERRGSKGSILSSLGLGDGVPSGLQQRRPSFQALGDTVMQLFGSK